MTQEATPHQSYHSFCFRLSLTLVFREIPCFRRGMECPWFSHHRRATTLSETTRDGSFLSSSPILRIQPRRQLLASASRHELPFQDRVARRSRRRNVAGVARARVPPLLRRKRPVRYQPEAHSVGLEQQTRHVRISTDVRIA